VTVHELTNPNVRLGELDIAAESGGEAAALRMFEAPVESIALDTTERGTRPAPRADWLRLATERVQYKPAVRTAALDSVYSSQPVGDELIHSITMEAVSAIESTAESAADDRPAPRVDWTPLSSGRVHYKPLERAVAFASVAQSQPLDDELALAMAVDAATLVDSPAAGSVDPLQVDMASNDVDDTEQPGRQLLARRGAFRPVAARHVR
jgi:hypothetical protein